MRRLLLVFLLKYMRAVELGAFCAYHGHFKRTKDKMIFSIALDELDHADILRIILNAYESKPSKIMDNSISFVGKTIGSLCKVCPLWSLNLVASLLEKINVINYGTVSKLCSNEKHKFIFNHLLETEKEHDEYFRSL